MGSVKETGRSPLPTAEAVTELRMLVAAGKISATEKLLDRLGPIDELPPEFAILRSRLAIDTQDWKTALPLLTSLMQRFPNRSGLHLDRALGLLKLGRIAEAEAALENHPRPSLQSTIRHIL